ncbi:hypothetical protein [Oceanidesulfovibrio indonesiensis]|uniref:hypothetical protein n=1 Tax=Oceanidesulfovibrio indonesiensis TaxID=54767 RepID=UPI0012947E13|nr:hypothetical protein [Oceanidesulfovibrio indonesiensis]
MGYHEALEKGSSGQSVLRLMNAHDLQLEEFLIPEALSLPFHRLDLVFMEK